MPRVLQAFKASRYSKQTDSDGNCLTDNVTQMNCVRYTLVIHDKTTIDIGSTFMFNVSNYFYNLGTLIKTYGSYCYAYNENWLEKPSVQSNNDVGAYIAKMESLGGCHPRA